MLEWWTEGRRISEKVPKAIIWAVWKEVEESSRKNRVVHIIMTDF